RCEAFEIVPCIQSLDSFSERLASFPFVIWYRSSSTLKSRPATTFLPAAALIEIDEQFSLPALDGEIRDEFLGRFQLFQVGNGPIVHLQLGCDLRAFCIGLLMY